jgi:hypothetical protein
MAIQKITSGIIQDGAIAAADIVSVANTAITGLIQAAQIGSANATLVTSGTLPAARLPAGTVLQVVNSLLGTLTTGTTIITLHNGIPQITEGFQVLSLAITPTSATSKLLIQVVVHASNSATSNINIALFQNSIANALAAATTYNSVATAVMPLISNYFMTSGTTSSTTFTVRVGSNGAGTISVNGGAGIQHFGGICYSSITITEIAA